MKERAESLEKIAPTDTTQQLAPGTATVVYLTAADNCLTSKTG